MGGDYKTWEQAGARLNKFFRVTACMKYRINYHRLLFYLEHYNKRENLSPKPAHYTNQQIFACLPLPFEEPATGTLFFFDIKMGNHLV